MRKRKHKTRGEQGDQSLIDELERGPRLEIDTSRKQDVVIVNGQMVLVDRGPSSN